MKNRKKDLEPNFSIHVPTKVASYPKVIKRPIYLFPYVM